MKLFVIHQSVLENKCPVIYDVSGHAEARRTYRVLRDNSNTQNVHIVKDVTETILNERTN